MSKARQSRRDPALVRVAQLRAAGRGWQSVADALNSEQPERDRPWTVPALQRRAERAAYWPALYDEAYKGVFGEAEARAVEVLRRALDDPDPNVRVRAASAILRAADARRPKQAELSGSVTFELVIPHRQDEPEADGDE